MKGGIYGINSVEWMLAMQAYNSQSVFCVPLYDTLGEFSVVGGYSDNNFFNGIDVWKL